ncbi:1-acyl-sn-glycerol-3-phosphate acyltransferase beta isoform X1 [Phalacrocorax carbo]
MGSALPAQADGLRSALVLLPQTLETAVCSGISSLALSPALVALARPGAAFLRTTSFAAGRIYDVRIIRTVVRTFKYFFGLRFEVEGLEHFKVEGPAIIVSNHQSTLDMMGLMEVLPDDCVQVGKKELMYAGTVGLVIYLGGVIFINRKSTTSAKMVMAEVAKTMATDNVKVWVYPEGTRNCTGDLLPFKKGAFHLAVQAQVPVIPVVYSSFTTFYNPKTNLFTSGKIKVKVLPPIDTKGLTSDDVSDLTERCFRTMRETLFMLSGNPSKAKDSS